MQAQNSKITLKGSCETVSEFFCKFNNDNNTFRNTKFNFISYIHKTTQLTAFFINVVYTHQIVLIVSKSMVLRC